MPAYIAVPGALGLILLGAALALVGVALWVLRGPSSDEFESTWSEPHQAETFKQLINGKTRIGWHCLTCDVEHLVSGRKSHGEALRLADEAAREHRLDAFAAVHP